MGGRWCADHGEQLARVARAMGKRDAPTRAVRPKPQPAKRVTTRDRALQLARAVHAADAPVSAADAAGTLGLSERSVGRIVSVAKGEGWIDTQPGREGGYVRGDAEPPGHA